MSAATLLQSNCPDLKLLNRGKVRDIYEVEDYLLIVTTDRISAFDVVLPNGIPHKGKVLNNISLFWFDYFKGYTKNHVVTADIKQMPQAVRKYEDQLAGRSLLALKAEVFPVECVARGYIVGSGWKDYEKTGAICGISLRKGLQKCAKLDEPIFTPATKATTGHDENISYERMEQIIGEDAADELRRRTLEIYRRGREYAESHGIIIADTKFEWGIYNGEIILIDEVLTPDSSRFWPKDDYHPGRDQASFDKQFVRDYLETLKWDKTPPGPALPEDVVQKTSEKYLQAYQLLTGKALKV